MCLRRLRRDGLSAEVSAATMAPARSDAMSEAVLGLCRLSFGALGALASPRVRGARFGTEETPEGMLSVIARLLFSISTNPFFLLLCG